MLKALELSGFKSFADRTRFEFPRGVSIVVGPNGSGKSNVVDAVKWVLGSQSAKSLRGHEMTDVIFNGCASRGPLGTAEVTLTLDNSEKILAIDARDVHVTRRVYRSGEGEYLINRQPCRLRDIRELLAVTGITTEAYCIIEQGKVDLLLQSSPRDRRVIFEEAAGISQFKAKKATAARRLERVDQNLVRLSDIVDEVESRLRSVRAQAGKARRYRECTTRLQHLRTQVGLVDWRALTKQITARESQLAELARQNSEREAAIAALESESQSLDAAQDAAAEAEHEIESQASATRAEIAALEAGLETQSARRTDIELEIARFRRQLAAMSSRSGNATEQLRGATGKLENAEDEYAVADTQYRVQREHLDHVERELEAIRRELDHDRGRQADAARNAAQLAQQATVLESEFRAVRAAGERYRAQLAELESQRTSRAAAAAQHEAKAAVLQTKFDESKATILAAEDRLAGIRRELTRVDKQQRHLEGRLHRTRERIDVLTELHERLEGLNSGVKDVLLAARGAPEGPLGDVRGVVADLFHVDVDTAPLVDVALGEFSQYLVISSAGRLLDWLNSKPLGVTGRVGFLRLDMRAPAEATDGMDLGQESGVMGRADQFVETAAEFQPLVERLLSRTWFVDRLATALRLAQTSGRGLSFVTSDGELLAPDGTLVVGPRQASAGLLSRRSELRACHEQLADLEKQLSHQQNVHARLDADRTREEQDLASTAAAQRELATQLAEHRRQASAAASQLAEMTQAVERVAADLRSTDAQQAACAAELAATRDRRTAAEQAAAQLQDGQQAITERLRHADEQAAALRVVATERRIAAAKCEQRVEMLRSQLEQAQRDQQERDQALADTRNRLAERERQLAELDATLLASRQELAELFVRKQEHAEELAKHAVATEEFRRARVELQERLRVARQQLATLQTQRHKLDIAANKLRHERQTLVDRMRDDYGIDLAAEAATEASGAAASAAGSLGARSAVEREIAELREQLAQIGSVNLDALAELDDLEARFGTLSQQYRDLVDAKAALERIIQRINVDSRQLFLDTLEVVRGHFRELFRRLFGGGEADIRLDEGEDVLECGIDIVACPPGKEACSISLLSGGEKTLTCVALLLAVFRSKPSPFCILDEVDAALDEANIGRFVQVLRDFLSFTQFLVVTHSKKTMAGADTLYGVTMQESGVSKHVSVRFEDVSEDGHIHVRGDSTLRRAA